MGTLGERVKRVRTSQHLSQEYVAGVLGICRSAVVDIESGKRKVSADELGKLSDLFLVPMEDLLRGKSMETPERSFARGFGSLDEADQREIMNLIEFKHAMRRKVE